MLDKIYVVHYSRLEDRKEYQKNIFSTKFENVEFIEQYDREDIQDIKFKYFIIDLNNYIAKSQVYKNFTFGIPQLRILSDAEISCAIKHLKALEKISLENEISLVIEDDAIPFDENDFIDEINKLLKDMPNDWDVIFLGEGCGIDFINKINKQQIKPNIFKIEHPASNCAEAYIVKPKSAKLLLKKMIPFQLPYDCELACSMAKLNMNVYWYLPSLFYQGSIKGKFNSSIR